MDPAVSGREDCPRGAAELQLRHDSSRSCPNGVLCSFNAYSCSKLTVIPYRAESATSYIKRFSHRIARFLISIAPSTGSRKIPDVWSCSEIARRSQHSVRRHGTNGGAHGLLRMYFTSQNYQQQVLICYRSTERKDPQGNDHLMLQFNVRFSPSVYFVHR